MIIVQIDFGLYVSGSFMCIQKQFRKFDAEIHIVRASAPFPSACCFESGKKIANKN